MVSASIPLGRIGQGLAGVGSKYAPIIGAAKAAAPLAGSVGQGLAAGAGFAGAQLIAKPIQGVAGWVVNWLPENIAGFMMWGGLALFFIDFKAGFDLGVTGNFHLLFAALAFIFFGVAMGFLNLGITTAALGVLFSLVGFVNASGSGNFGARALAAATIAVSFFFYWKFTSKFADKEGADFFRYLPLLAFVDVFAMPMFRDQIFSGISGIAGNMGAWIYGGVFFVFNRLLFPLWVYFPAITLYNNTRVARRVLIAILLFYFIAALPTVTSQYHAKVSKLTPEETQVAASLWERFRVNLNRILTGQFLQAPLASAYEKAEELYGFGTPKEEPKIGLQVIDDPNMPKAFDLNIFNAASPSIVLHVPNQLPSDSTQRFIEVVDIGCEDKSAKASQGGLIEPVTKADLAMEPLKVAYRLPSTAKCEFTGMAEGKKTVEFDVKYKFEGSAELSTAFMRSDKLDALVGNPDPKVMQIGLKDIPPASARYDNGPVAITWGPVELANPPARVDLEKTRPVGLVVYVAKSGSWDGEIAGIESVELTTPPGITLSLGEKNCMFEGQPGAYTVQRQLIWKNKDEFNDKEKGTTNPSNLRFIGEGLPFTCRMTVSKETLTADWVGAQFKVTVNYLFSTKKTVNFEVKGKQKSEAEVCKDTGGAWDATKTPKCDCGKDKAWESLTNGCTASTKDSPTQPAVQQQAATTTTPSTTGPFTGAQYSQVFQATDDATKGLCTSNQGKLLTVPGGLQCDCSPKIWRNNICQSQQQVVSASPTPPPPG